MNNLIERAIKIIPGPDLILNEAFKALGLTRKKPEELFKNFDFYVRSLEDKAFEIYRRYEGQAFNQLRELWIGHHTEKLYQILEKRDLTALSEKLKELIDLTREMEFRMGQKRKARGGATFQKIIKLLLNAAGVPCEEPHKETKASSKFVDTHKQPHCLNSSV